jgi:hypothetical protein
MGVKLSDLTTETAPASNDILIIADPVTGVAKKLTVTALKTLLDGLGGGTDTTAPTIVSAVVNTANTIQIVFSESVVVTTAGWSYKLNGGNWAVSSVSGSGNTWTFTMGASATSTDTITRSYSTSTGNTVDGASNELAGFTDVAVTNSIPAGGSFDADAQAFITAANITSSTQRTAINTLVVNLKADGLWTKFDVIYPFVGGSASSHKFNLVNPADTDAAFRAVFVGTWAHSAQGVSNVGETSHIDTKYKHSTDLASKTSMHLSFYSRTNSSGGYDIDVKSTGKMRTLLAANGGSSTAYGYHGSAISATNANSQGLYTLTRQSATALKLFKNTTQLDVTQTDDISASTLNDQNIWLGTDNDGGTTNGNYTGREYAWFSAGDGLSDADITSLQSRVQAFQTALSRNV